MVLKLFIALALLSPFFFPWPIAVALLAIVSIRVPLVALLGGVLIDVLYFVPSVAVLPLGSVLGALGFVIATLSHDFMKARIMGA